MADIELLKKLRKNKRISITKQINSLYSLIQEVEAAVKKALDEANSYFEQIDAKDKIKKINIDTSLETLIGLKKHKFEAISKRISDIHELINKNAPAKKVEVLNKKLLGGFPEYKIVDRNRTKLSREYCLVGRLTTKN